MKGWRGNNGDSVYALAHGGFQAGIEHDRQLWPDEKKPALAAYLSSDPC
jgi:hypothetical protein